MHPAAATGSTVKLEQAVVTCSSRSTTFVASPKLPALPLAIAREGEPAFIYLGLVAAGTYSGSIWQFQLACDGAHLQL
jgi:hypothetical protein